MRNRKTTTKNLFYSVDTASTSHILNTDHSIRQFTFSSLETQQYFFSDKEEWRAYMLWMSDERETVKNSEKCEAGSEKALLLHIYLIWNHLLPESIQMPFELPEASTCNSPQSIKSKCKTQIEIQWCKIWPEGKDISSHFKGTVIQRND